LCAQEINASQLGREIGVTPATARRWLDLLEHTFQWLELFPIEMKCKTALSKHDTRGLRAFREIYKSKKIAPAIIIYAGKECYQVDAFTTAIPWNALQEFCRSD